MYRIPPWLVHVLLGESEADVMLEYWRISWRRSFIPVGKYLISSMAPGFTCCFGDGDGDGDDADEDVEKHFFNFFLFLDLAAEEVTFLLKEEFLLL